MTPQKPSQTLPAARWRRQRAKSLWLSRSTLVRRLNRIQVDVASASLDLAQRFDAGLAAKHSLREAVRKSNHHSVLNWPCDLQDWILCLDVASQLPAAKACRGWIVMVQNPAAREGHIPFAEHWPACASVLACLWLLEVVLQALKAARRPRVIMGQGLSPQPATRASLLQLHRFDAQGPDGNSQPTEEDLERAKTHGIVVQNATWRRRDRGCGTRELCSYKCKRTGVEAPMSTTALKKGHHVHRSKV